MTVALPAASRARIVGPPRFLDFQPEHPGRKDEGDVLAAGYNVQYEDACEHREEETPRALRGTDEQFDEAGDEPALLQECS